MKTKRLMVAVVMLSFLVPVGVERASALSCLPIDMYLESVVGNEDIVIFEATSLDRIEDKEYTAEVLKVTKAQQGWVEDKIFVYHEKHPDWAYLCNSGPKAKGSTGLYVASRNDQNQYSVHQRLDLTDPLVTELKKDLAAEKIEGGVGELTKTDRMNQIMTSIYDLLNQISILFKEYHYWKAN
jgi:hypothetical protein